MVLLTGPRAAGRSAVRAQFLSRGFQAPKSKVPLKGLKFLTTNTGAWQRNPSRYSLITEEEMNSLRSQGKLVSEFEERSSNGLLTWSAALSFEQLISTSIQGDLLLLDGPPQLLEALSK